MTKKTLIWIYLLYLLLLSIITFCLYGADKRKAKKGLFRIPEKVLLWLPLFGGAFGGLLGMKVFHHKTKGEHWYFSFVNVLGVLLHAALLLCVLFVFPL